MGLVTKSVGLLILVGLGVLSAVAYVVRLGLGLFAALSHDLQLYGVGLAVGFVVVMALGLALYSFRTKPPEPST